MANKGEPPAQYIDGWVANKAGMPRTRNPYDINSQFASFELWTEGWMSRKYAWKNNQPLPWDDYVPRYEL